MFVALLIFIIVIFLCIVGRPHRAIVSILGAMFMVLFKIAPRDKVFLYVDWNVIFLLIGMMIVVFVMSETGALQYLAIKVIKLSGGDPQKILIYLALTTGFLSAFLDNVTTVIIIAPITILIANNLNVSPKPFLIIEILASNIGGTATLIGDPPNIIIGSAANIGFSSFLINLSPIIIIMLILLPYLVRLLYKEKLKISYERRARVRELNTQGVIQNKRLLGISLIVFSFILLGFLLHEYINLEVSIIALSGAFMLLVFSPYAKNNLEKIFNQIEWTTIFFLIGFFIVIGGLEETSFTKYISYKFINHFTNNLPQATIFILWFSGIVSSILGTIPFTITMIPLIKNIATHLTTSFPINPLWWALSLGACLGGNIFIFSAAANVVVADVAEKNGFSIRFWEFLKYGIVVTLINLFLGSLYLYLRFFVFLK